MFTLSCCLIKWQFQKHDVVLVYFLFHINNQIFTVSGKVYYGAPFSQGNIMRTTKFLLLKSHIHCTYLLLATTVR